MAEKALFIVEGERDRDYVNAITRCMDIRAEVFTVHANAYMLYRKLAADNFDLNIEAALLEMRGIDEADCAMLRKEAPFTYTYLIFDLDLQDNRRPAAENMSVIKEMIEHFTNETDNTIGKIYINYPMVESLWDYDKENPEEYRDRCVEVSELSGYKRLVGKRGCPMNIGKYTLGVFKDLGILNIKKANWIVNNEWAMPVYDQYLTGLGQAEIRHAEEDYALQEGKIPVLSSIPFIMIDYWGNRDGFYDSLRTNS